MRAGGQTAVAGVLLVLAATAAGADEPGRPMGLPAVIVIGTTPVPGIGTPLEQVPANVQVIHERDLREQPGPSIADHLGDARAGFAASRPGGNPYQPDISFRGFSASPLFGAPQGLSVYLDGVRVNEAFGDVVNWDLIPRIAVSAINVIPGSNPAFGLNTLGGALAIETKSGAHFPGTALRGYGGSFGRFGAEFEAGGARDGRHYYLAGNRFSERGWRDFSPSRVDQVFARLGAGDPSGRVELTLLGADTSLDGTQALPLSMLAAPRQPYTWPDRTENRLAFANLSAKRIAGADNVIAGNIFVRDLSSRNLNSNVNDDCAAGPCSFNAINDAARIDETRVGFALQATLDAPVANRENQFSAGVSFEASRSAFDGSAQAANFSPNREAVGISGFVTETAVHTRQRYTRLYLLDTLTLAQDLYATMSASHNVAHVQIADRTGTQPALDGRHRFSRLLPAAGLAYAPRTAESYYTNASWGMRAPTAIELTCADPNAPCRLPSVFLADPPLKPVLSRTLEAGVRRPLGATFTLATAVYRTDLENDIQFASAGGGALNAGFFQNVGRTRRQGVEIDLEAKLARWWLAARYARVEATFRSPFAAHSPYNSSADANGDILVQPGHRIPGTPRDALKLRAKYAIGGASIGASVALVSGQHARGDENNGDANGRVPGYALAGLDAQWDLARGWRLFATVENLFNSRTAAFGTLGGNFFTGAQNSFDAGNVRAEQFRTPGAPRGIWVGIAWRPHEPAGWRSRQ
jgi:outer membrane receptor protein involved in Fe transport